MGTNFHTAWIDDTTRFQASDMNTPLSYLDRAITYLKGFIVHTDGTISYNKATGVLTWSGTIRILFNTAAGNIVQNTIAAGNVTLADNQMAYVTLNETNDTALTVSVATITTAAASPTIAYNIFVLAYRNTSSDNIFFAGLKDIANDPDKLVQALTCADSVSVDWSRGSTAEITLDRATTTFAFTGARNGQRCVLIVKQYSGPGAVAFGSEVRAGADLPSPPTLSSTADKKDYLGYIYNGTDSKYDFVSLSKGF